MSEMYPNVSEIYERTPEIEIKYEPIDYQNEIKKRSEAAAVAQLDKNNRAVFETILDHWDLSPTEANLNVIRAWCNGEISVEKFQLMLESPGERESLAWKGTREMILQEIAALLEAKGDRHTYNNARAIAAMRYWTKSALRARLAELKFKAGKSAVDARNLLAEHRAAEAGQNKWHPYEPMPDSITSAVIRAATTDRIKYLNSRFGHEQVKARLNQK